VQQDPDRPRPLWAIPLAAGLLPAVAALVALHLSVRLELIPACNPFIEGCVSISRAARHDLSNHIFRALVLPAAALQGLTWMLCTGWLKGLGAGPDRPLRALPWLGLLAALFLVLYGTFLGTEGEAYRWMRRYGIVFYFGFTCICMVISAGHLSRLAGPGSISLPMRLDRVLVGLCMVLLGLGLASAFSPLYTPDEPTRDRVGNALEWNGALIFTLFFLSLAWLWHTTGFSAKLTSERR
jgi:Frag1/DRAM/Sfk1 family protein